MELVELSDLEEGEILEYDTFSPVEASGDTETKKHAAEVVKKEDTNSQHRIKDKQGKNSSIKEPVKYGCVNKNLRQKVGFKGKSGGHNMNSIELESISSEGDCLSDNNSKMKAGKKDRNRCNGKIRKEGKQGKQVKQVKQGKQSTYLYGTVEDIMSEIGETICRESRCNYKERKSKAFVGYSNNSYDLWRDKVFSSHIKDRKRKRTFSESDSEAEMFKDRMNKKKKRRRRNRSYNEYEMEKKSQKARDFDEMRQNLLEKLNKQKAEQALRALTSKRPPQEEEKSEIQEVEMLVDCTNYVDNPSGSVKEICKEGLVTKAGPKTQEKVGDEELDLIKLRLIALASNKKGKSEGNQSKTEAKESVQEEKKSSGTNSKKTVDLDKNELLLRAEALKTALLKKHQNRLMKSKLEKSKAVESSSDNDLNSLSSPGEDRGAFKERTGESFTETCGESTREEDRKFLGLLCNPPSRVLNQVPGSQAGTAEVLVSNGNTKRVNIRLKNKRRKKKSCSFANCLKENSDLCEVLEEDDHKLRSQLLNDLFRRKSMKDLEKKSVLMDSIQTSENQIPLVKDESSNDSEKPPTIEKNPVKKGNLSKTSKPIAIPKIPVPEIQRIIVHLGSEDSSDENDPPEKRHIPMEESKGDTEVQDTAKVESADKKEKVQENIQASYEKSVELLLSQARKKIEGRMQSAKTNNLTTPEAVYKHLPLSQRLEYLRLKQKIAERERLKQQKNENSPSDARHVDSPSPDVSITQKPRTQNSLPMSSWTGSSDIRSVKTDVPNTKLTSRVRNVSGSLVRLTDPRLVVNKQKNNLMEMNGKGFKEKDFEPPSIGFTDPQMPGSILLPSRQILITKLKLLLRKIKIEKMIEENYEKEISKLKNQLNIFETKKLEQRFKIKKLGEESMKTYKAIQGITGNSKDKVVKREESGMAKEKKEEKVEKGENGRLKNEGNQSQEGKSVPFEPEGMQSKEIEVESENDKEIINSEVCGGSGGVDVRTDRMVSSKTLSDVELLQYSSPLEVFKKVSDMSDKVDPNVMMCQFDLMGTCKDEECKYQHLRKS